jgi:hypothetical protein
MPLKRPKYDPNGNHHWEWTPEGKAKLSEMRMGEANPMWKGGRSPEEKKAYHRKYYYDNVDRYRAYKLRKYGITKAQYEEMLIAQHGVCAICGASPGRRILDVDHCHNSKTVRGLLCEQCNKGVGHFQDNPELLEAAAKYLKEGEMNHALKISCSGPLP